MSVKRGVTVAGLVGAMSVVGVASAAWMAVGTTPGVVQAANPRLTVNASMVQDVYPGGVSHASVGVTNSNAYPVRFGDFGFDSVTVDQDHPSCPPSVLQIVWSNPNVMMPPQASQTFDVGVSMDASAPQSCTGASFNVVWRAVGSIGTP